MAIKKEFLPDLDLNSDQNKVLIQHLSSGWKRFKILSIERINSNDNVHISGWVVTHSTED